MQNELKYEQTRFLEDELDVKLISVAQDLSFSTPKYKLDNFVGGAQITPYAKIKQWFMELRAREDAVEHLEYLVKKKEIELEIEEEKLEFVTDEKKKKLIQLDIFDGNIDLRKYKRSLNDAYKERKSIIDLIKSFLDSEDGKLPNGESFMEVFKQPELEAHYEHEYWTVRMAKQAMLDMVSYGRLGTGNLDSILMMKPEQQQQVLALTAQYSIAMDRNVNELMGRAATGEPLPLLEQKLKEQLKLGSINNQINEQLL